MPTPMTEAQEKVLYGMQRRAGLGLAGSVTARFLGKLLSMNTAQVSFALRGLEELGLVGRNTKTRERAAHRWHLTTAGHQA